MFNVIKPLATLTMIALGGVALAQETAAPATDAPADPQVGQVYVKETSGDWELRCLKVESGDEPCQIYQLLKDADGNSIMEVTMFPMPADQQAAAAATLLVPLMTRLSEGIMIQVDDADPRRYPIEFCNQGGCVTRAGFTAEELAAFKAGSNAKVRIVRAETAPEAAEVILDMSLAGFTAGFDKATPPTN